MSKQEHITPAPDPSIAKAEAEHASFGKEQARRDVATAKQAREDAIQAVVRSVANKSTEKAREAAGKRLHRAEAHLSDALQQQRAATKRATDAWLTYEASIDEHGEPSEE